MFVLLVLFPVHRFNFSFKSFLYNYDYSGASPVGSLNDNPFPDMTIQVDVSPPPEDISLPPDERVSSSDDSTPQISRRNSPRPFTPRTTLRTSLRALSRQSRATPASRQNERFQNVSPVKSSRGEIKGQNDSNKVNVQSQYGATGCESEKSKKGKASDVEDDKLEIIEQETEAADVVNSTEYTSMDSEVLGAFNITQQYSSSRMDRGSPNFDPYLLRGTPLSLTSAISYDSKSALFFGDSDNFYYVCPYIGDDQDLTWRNCELFHLVEECFQKKITAEYVMRIIYSRRKYDANARAFLKKSPTEMIEKIRFGMPQEDVPRCVSS